jgi:homoserine dehydrogenase
MGRVWHLGFVGLGNVNRALVGMLEERRAELERRWGLRFKVTMAATRRRGAVVDDAGLPAERLLAGEWPQGPPALQAIETAPIDLLFEGTTLDPVAGEPATTHVRTALRRGVSVVSANKGPVAFAAGELMRLARATGAGFRFESAVADCVPIFDLVETAVPIGRIRGFHGVLNATSNIVLQAVAHGRATGDAVREAQRLGIAEADPSNDLDGWDQAVKAVILANVLLGRDLRPNDVKRTALGDVDVAWLRREVAAGRVVRLVSSGAVSGEVRVAAEAFAPGAFLATLGDGALGLVLDTEMAGELRVAATDPGVAHTAYGMLTDFVAIHQGRRLLPSPLLQD